MQPTNSDIMTALHQMHGDVKVALDRTVTHERNINTLSSKVEGHGLDIAKAKGQATLIGGMASIIVAAFFEIGKAIFGGPHAS